MRKEIMYALIGGAAVVGAAVAYHLASQKGESGDIDDDLEQLGELQKDEQGYIRFDYFLKIFQICSFYGKSQFAAKKKQFIVDRRKALANNDDKEYEKIVCEMTQEEEVLIQQKLLEIIDKVGISEQEFQKNVMHHGGDQNKAMQIMQMQQQAQTSQGNDEYPTLSREQTMETFKVQLRIQLEQVDAIQAYQQQAMASGDMQGQEGQIKMMIKMMVQQSRSVDRLYQETGIEEDQLNASIIKLELQSKDEEFQKLVQENLAKVHQKTYGSQGPGGMF